MNQEGGIHVNTLMRVCKNKESSNVLWKFLVFVNTELVHLMLGSRSIKQQMYDIFN